MGGGQSKPKSSTDAQSIQTTIAPTVPPVPCFSNYPIKERHLALAFVAGILLTLLLTSLVYLIIRSYRKRHTSPQALDLHSDPLSKFPSVPDEALTSASMTSKISNEKRDHLTAKHSADTDSIVYAQIKLTDSPCFQ
nr:PREDICTED: transmembrane protein C1orf162 homolog [Rhinolophus sinicus]XP_019586113.1 PREDICTED: transmembrane protein C1orf162 homolog [Rhinolophus sinicus]